MSSLHVTVLETDAVFPHASIAVKVLVCDLLQVPLIPPSEELIVGVPQASLAVAVPNAASISPPVGLHPSDRVVPLAVITGTSESIVQVTVLLTSIAILPQASVTLNVLVWESKHGSPLTTPSFEEGVPTVQLSVAVAVPNAASISPAVGLHPSDRVVPLAVITGISEFIVQVTVRLTSIAIFPQASVALNVLV